MSDKNYTSLINKCLKYKIRLLIIITGITFYSLNIFAQITTDFSPNPTALVNNLVGNGVTFSGVSYTGDAQARGLFDGTNSPALNLKSGVILSTGQVWNATGPNDDPLNGSPYWVDNLKSKDFGRINRDADLEATSGCTDCTNDVAVLEFDFTPQSTPISFKYIFASEEYPFYVCSGFNDVFAFFVSGPNPGGGNYIKKNIAFIPGTTIPVAINSVNSGTPGFDPNCPCYWPSANCTSLGYSAYFNDNGDGSTPWANTKIQYNGFTTPLTATIDVIPCQTYHIKLAIADIADGKYDSAVLIEAGSFSSPSAGITKSYANMNVDTLAIEGGCNDVQVCFTLPATQSTDMVIPLNYVGSTTDITGLDYPVLPNSITIPANQLQACFTISPIADGITEGTEKIVINAKTSSCGFSKAFVFVNDYIPLTATPNPSTVSICEGASTTISVTPAGGISNKPYTYLWSNAGGTNSSTTVSPLTTTIYTVTVKDACNYTAKANIEVKVNPKPIITLSNNAVICSGGSTTLTADGAGVGGSYLWNTGQPTATITVNPPVNTTYTVTVTTSFGCSNSAKVSVTINTAPTITATAKNDKLCAGQPVEIDAVGGVSYVWSSSPLDNSLTPQKTLASPIVSPLMTTTYTVTGTDASGCTNTASVVVNVKSPPVTGMKDTSICMGGTATLIVIVPGGGITYKWNTNEITPTISVNPIVTTTYTVTVTESTFGCQTAVSAVVNVNPLPNADAGAAQSICKGNATSFTATGGTIFHWDNGTDVATINVNPIKTTTYTVTVSDAIGCSATDFVVLTVNDNPTVDLGNDVSICNGLSTILTANASPNVTYKWDDGSITPTLTVSPANTTAYTVTVTDLNGCKATDQINVTVNPNPIPIGQDKEICDGGTANLVINGAGINGQYLWDTGDNTSSINVSPANTKAYTVTLTNSNGCIAIKTLTVTVHPNPVAVLPPDYSICTGSSTTITALGAGANGNYNWSNGNSGAIINVTPLNTTTYIVTVTDQFSCTDSAKVIISVNTSPAADAGKDTSICFGDAANLLGKGGLNYLWSTGEITPGIQVSPQTTTVYTLTVTDNNGCIGKGSVKVTVNPIPTSDFSINPSPICINQLTTITFTGSASPGATFNWNIDGDLTKTGPGPIQYSWNTNGSKTITLTIIDNKCTSTQTLKTILVNDLPIADFSAVNVSDCQPLTVKFTNNSTQTNFSSTYLWDFGDGQISTDKDPAHVYTESGTYSVSLKVSNAAVSCDDTKSITDMIEVYPIPDARYYVQPSSTVSELNPTVFVMSNSLGKIVNYKWTLSDDNSTYTDSTFMHNFTKAGTYDVTLVVTSDLGCKDSTSGKIIVKKDFTIYIPNAFIPGKCKETENCQFRVRGSNIENFDMTIYNRWGGVVFSSQDISIGWDGKIKGSYAEIGMYPYIINYRDSSHKAHTLHGQVTLIR